MGSAFSGIEMGKRGLLTQTQAMQTIGHNLSNASTEGYSRQRVKIGTVSPLYNPSLNRANTPGQIGQGAETVGIERIRDTLLDAQVLANQDDAGFWETRDKYILMMEQVYNEPDGSSVRDLMDQFWDGWQELSLNPEQMAARQAVLKRGQTLTEGIHARYDRMADIRTMVNDDVKYTVDKINGYLEEIGELNLQIEKSEALGDSPNDLLDRRDLLVENIASLISVTSDGRDSDEFNLHTGGLHLIQGKEISYLELEPNANNEGMYDVVWEANGDKVNLTGGKLASLVEVRDEDLLSEIKNLDFMTLNMMDMVNEIHFAGKGLNGSEGQNFFSDYPFVNNLAGNVDTTGDGELDHSYIYRMTGTAELNPEDVIGIRGTITLNGADGNIEIAYNPTDRVQDVLDRINFSSAEVKAVLNEDNHLVMKASFSDSVENPDFVIRHLEDSGHFLAGYASLLGGSGAENAFDWETPDAILSLAEGGTGIAVAPTSHPSRWMEVNPELITDPASLAAAVSKEYGDTEIGSGDAALKIASLRNSEIRLGTFKSFNDYFADSVAELGLKGEMAQINNESYAAVLKQLQDTRESVSGVNMDEELTEMIKFQHGYNAAARFVNEIDQMLDTVINKMGV